MITKTYQLDMHSGGVPVVVHLSQYDSDFSLVFNLYSSSGTFTVESGTTAAIRGTKSDGMGYSVNATLDISNKKVTVAGDQQMTAVAGKQTFELTLTRNNKELNTANFILDVERAALDKDTLASDSVIKELVNVIDRTDELIATARQIDSDKQIIAGYKTDAQTAASNAATSESNAASSASAAERAKDTAVSTVNGAIDAINAAKTSAVSEAQDQIQSDAEDALESITEKESEVMAEINQHAQQIIAITTEADQVAAEALSTANNAENHMATLDSQMKKIETALDNVSIDPDDLGLYQDPDTFYVYPTYKDVRSENGIPLAGGGGGGGGGDVVSAVLSVENTSGWLSKTIPSGSSCVVSFLWSSIEDEMPTGDGAMRISVNEIVRSTRQIQQGNVSVDLGPYLGTGSNKVKVRISDTYDQGKTITFNITSIELSLSSSFDPTTPYSGVISFPYTPVGAVEKTVHFILDGQQIGTQVTSVSGRQMSYTIPAQSHGNHALRVYFETTINNETVRSNELYYEFIAIEPLNPTVIIASSFDTTQAWEQYSLIPIPFQVYTPTSLTSEVTISVDGEPVSVQTVDRSEQSYSYRANTYGTKVVTIESGGVTKTLSFTVNESEIDVEPETEALALYLASVGRSNNEEHPEVWEYETGASKISASLTGFNWSSDGWQKDDDGATCLRVAGPARVEIPYKPFQTDFRATGKTLEIEFATRNVLDYDAVILSCLNGGRGLSMTAQKATLISEQSEIGTQYKEDEHVRIAFVAEKRSENRLLFVYINGITSGVVQYPTDDDFAQVSPVNISIGSNDCTMDIYCIRVYNQDLNGNQILDNWIADTQDGPTMLERYTRNTVYDAYGKIVPANLPADLPYFILNAPELPQYKGDKKTITGSYVDRMFPSKSFTFEGCQINVQGTSSAVYARKNYDMQFKNGFDMNSGNHADNYMLAEGVIPFNRFVLKADVASSEGANNVELVKLYNDASPYKTPEMQEDSRVRWGIYGFPIVVFWNNTDTQELSFMGKYNFNLPKRAPAPYGYANDDTMESWEFQNNTSNLMLFKTDYFDETMYTDPDTGDTKELWRYDYEARFPSDEWTNYAILQEFQSFVYSTYRAEATGDALPSPMTYEGVEYTTDSADYRLAKFRAEFPTYAELNSFLFYYIFTELFLMVDSRAKNLFIGFNGGPVTASGRVATRKATAQPYDMDTAIGTNNEGTLVFGYGLEDTDHLPGGANIFNGQESVLWCNVRDAFSTEIRQLYQTLRSAGVLSYNTIESRYEEHQIKWPEAVWIEDARFKYTMPLTNPDPGKEPTGDYLSMLQGSKAEQRKWWLTNRFKYMDSRWNAGDALAQVIILRGYAKANITVTPYADIYPTIKYASYVVQERGQHGQPTTLVCPLDTLDDTEISIYSAPQLQSVGDLSQLKVGFANFSQATRLQEIKIGDSSSSYSNTNLYSLTLGNNVLLKKLDVRNCVGLGDTSMQGHTQTVVDISNCSIIEEIYFDGTKVQGVTLPNGGNIKILHLPDTITNLTIMNQKAITDLTVAGYSNISTLRLENVPTINTRQILNGIPANARVRLIGFTWECETASEIDAIYDILDTMRGIDESGNNTDKAQVSGTIHIGSLTGSEIAEFNERYPYITIDADHTTSHLYYYNFDGSQLLYDETITDGGNGTYSGSPSKSSDAQYSYTFAGWNKNKESLSADPNATKNVVADRNVYAAYTTTVRTYTVYWKNEDGTTLETDNNVPYGTTPTYDGPTPTYDGDTYRGWEPAVGPITGNTTYVAQYKPKYTVRFYNGTILLQTVTVKEGNTATYTGTTPTNTEGTDFLGWSTTNESHTADAILTNITANKDVYAAFEQAVVVEEITDSWDTIIANIDNGTYATKYKLGNYKPLDLGTEGTINMQIVAMDADELASGGTAPLTFLGMELLNTGHAMNTTSSNVGGWNSSAMRSYLLNTIQPLVPSTIAARLQTVKKYSSVSNNGQLIVDGQITYDKLWIPGVREVFINNDSKYHETQGPAYAPVFTDSTRLIKKRLESDSSTYWGLRSCSVISPYFEGINNSGNLYNLNPTANNTGVCLGFCLGLEQETITDSWDTILANTNYATDYAIGDTKYIDLGTEGKHLMEIVGIDVDDRADGNGKAGLTWISKTLLKTAKPKQEPGSGNYNGWANCDLRTYLNNSILPLIPSNVRSGIVPVTKITGSWINGAFARNGETTTESIWIPGAREVCGDKATFETTGPFYSGKFANTTSTDASRIKRVVNSGGTSGSAWWLRSSSTNSGSYGVTYLGAGDSLNFYNTYNIAIALGFCTN